MSPDMFYQVVVPLIGVANTALLAITTPQDEFNYFSELMNLKSSLADAKLGTKDQSLFDVTQLGMCCEACRKTKAACRHKLSMNPHWKPPERVAKVDAIMATNPALRDRETRGVNNSSRHYVLDEETINSFRDRVTHEFPAGQPDVLFTSIDPSGGGSGSDFAIFTIAIVAGQQVVIVGIDTCSSFDSDAVTAMIEGHFHTLRTHPIYSRCFIRCYFESNMSFVDADRWAKLIENNPRYLNVVEMARFDKKGRIGTWTTEEKKKAFLLEMQRTFPTMKYATHFVTSRVDKNSIKQDFIDQSRTFRLDVIAPKGMDSTALTSKYHITGKSEGKKDDIMMSFGI